jgi:hypothetical protein
MRLRGLLLVQQAALCDGLAFDPECNIMGSANMDSTEYVGTYQIESEGRRKVLWRYLLVSSFVAKSITGLPMRLVVQPTITKANHACLCHCLTSKRMG